MGISWKHKSSTTTTTTTSNISGGVASVAVVRDVAKNQSTNCCYCLRKLMRILRKQYSRMLLCEASRPPTFHCHYDALSYSRNFDTSGWGGMSSDDNYDYFYAFSSRFVAAPSAAAPPSLVGATSH
ncbi:hypothetical protein Scep_013324 [Stephania cephalantha]|uniref:Uncharacterized protein n=1 Tax=Stephania cephalantha TaxID=152367 RepID=A0AAP0PAP0_9MAGN